MIIILLSTLRPPLEAIKCNIFLVEVAKYTVKISIVFSLSFPVQMKNADDLEDDMEAIIHDFEAKNNRTLLHSVHFY